MITSAGSNIQSIWTEERDGRVYQVFVVLTAKDKTHLAAIIRKISAVSGVVEVFRNINE